MFASSSKRARSSTMTVTSLPALRRRDQRVHQRRVVPGAVQGLLDGQHLRIGGRLAQEIHHRREALERVVQQHVLLADHREQVGGADAGASGTPGVKIGYLRSGRCTRSYTADRRLRFTGPGTG